MCVWGVEGGVVLCSVVSMCEIELADRYVGKVNQIVYVGAERYGITKHIAINLTDITIAM